MSRIFERALDFAWRAHRHQRRKYTGEPYITHPIEVAAILSDAGFGEEVQAAALLHDVVEDCGVSEEHLRDVFGPTVAALVMEVTDVSRPWDGNRAKRKALDRAHVAKASPQGQSIKLADLISNTASIVQHDPSFAPIYLREKHALLGVLVHGHPDLRRRAIEQIEADLPIRGT